MYTNIHITTPGRFIALKGTKIKTPFRFSIEEHEETAIFNYLDRQLLDYTTESSDVKIEFSKRKPNNTRIKSKSVASSDGNLKLNNLSVT